MIQHILVAYDGSEPADKAYALALELAHRFGAALQVLAVARPPDPPEDEETQALLESAREHYEAHFAALREQATGFGITPRFDVVVGHPAEQIIHRAEQEGVDHIVMGHRGKTFFSRWLLGSVGKQVMAHANCSVTIVR